MSATVVATAYCSGSHLFSGLLSMKHRCYVMNSSHTFPITDQFQLWVVWLLACTVPCSWENKEAVMNVGT